MSAILENELYYYLIKLCIFLLPFIIAGIHFKRYNFFQGILSLICLPMITLGIIVFVIENINLTANDLDILMDFAELFDPYYSIHQGLYKLTTLEWLYNTGWIFMPTAVLYFLTLGYSITARKKKKRNKE